MVKRENNNRSRPVDVIKVTWSDVTDTGIIRQEVNNNYDKNLVEEVKIEMHFEKWVGYAYVNLRLKTFKAEGIIIKAQNHNILKCSFVTINYWVFNFAGFLKWASLLA